MAPPQMEMGRIEGGTESFSEARLDARARVNEAMVATGFIDHPIKMIYNTTGVIIGMTHIMLPIMVEVASLDAHGLKVLGPSPIWMS